MRIGSNSHGVSRRFDRVFPHSYTAPLSFRRPDGRCSRTRLVRGRSFRMFEHHQRQPILGTNRSLMSKQTKKVKKKAAPARAKRSPAKSIKRPIVKSIGKAAAKRVYYFGPGKTEGRADMKDLLGGKGANLADMTTAGLPVPPGFTITTESCGEYNDASQKLPRGLMDEVRANIAKVEKASGKKFGDPNNPLLLACRSGAKMSMPGMMDTVLNIGLNDEVVAGMANLTGNERFAYDSYRRLINMYGDTV